jgi:hypothetical protein
MLPNSDRIAMMRWSAVVDEFDQLREHRRHQK